MDDEKLLISFSMMYNTCFILRYCS